jgi:hypothetical protein
MNKGMAKLLKEATREMARNKAMIDANPRVTKSHKPHARHLGKSPSSMKTTR